LGNLHVKWKFVAAEISDNIILGIDFLEYFGAVIDLLRYALKINGESIPATCVVSEGGQSSQVCILTVGKRTVVPPNSMKILKANSNKTTKSDLVIHPNDLKGLLIPSFIGKEGQCFYAVVKNGTEKYITLKKGYDMGIGLEIDNLIPLDETDRFPDCSSMASFVNNMGCHIETDKISNNSSGLPSCGSDKISDRLNSVNLPTPLTQGYDQQDTDRFSDKTHANQSILKCKSPMEDDNVPIKATIGYSVRIIHSKDTNGSHQQSWTSCDRLPASDSSEGKEVKLPDHLTDLY
jgi:hypothetical protein